MKKLSIKKLEVQSFVTKVKEENSQTCLGGRPPWTDHYYATCGLDCETFEFCDTDLRLCDC